MLFSFDFFEWATSSLGEKEENEKKRASFSESLTSGVCRKKGENVASILAESVNVFLTLSLSSKSTHCFETFPLAVLLVESSVRDLHISTSLASLSVSFVLLFLAASDHLSDSLPCPIKLAESCFGRTKLRDPTDLYTATLSNCK